MNPDDLPDLAHLHLRAQHGDTLAQVELALHLRHHGEHEPASHWLHRAAQAGDNEAAYQLGLGFAYGLGAPHDPVRARHWLRIAHQGGHPEAQDQLQPIEALLAERVEQARQLKAAAQQGDLQALYTLAEQLASGHFAEPDPRTALRCYQLAAEHGHARASLTLARHHEQRHPAQALPWLIRAVHAGDGEAQSIYAQRYAEGRIPSHHPGAADAFARCRWLYPELRAPDTLPPSPAQLRAAAERGDLPARYLYALHLLQRDAPGAQAQAIALLHQGAERDYPPALCELARAHAIGAGVPHDPERALALTLAAARLGHFGARTDLLTSYGLRAETVDALLAG